MDSLIGTLRANRRICNLLAAVACFAMIGYALYTQSHDALDPCPLCIFQRVGIAALGVGFLLAAALPARPPYWGWIGTLLVFLPALITGSISARHLYIQSLPAGEVPACGATLDYMLDVFPLTDVLKKVLTGSGECAKVDWTFLGLSMPGWVLICAVGLG
ncbi:MAG: disulfide bond formation protein B, partial [Nevskiaceae bacterium]|nr:disulfide bond formation protein B [Nevskiaceae bacterium]